MMKKLLFISMCLFLLSSVKAQDIVVGADKSFTQSLNDYNTFGWSADIDKIPEDAIFLGPNGVYIFNNESTRASIKEAIKYELNAKGFKETATNPEILVLFQITEQPGELVTYNGYQTVGGEKVRTTENRETVEVKPGTLLINLVDAKSGVVAWQGYASGILNPDMINDNVKVREAVSSIFKEFKFQAKE